jgi:hypothetical protein
MILDIFFGITSGFLLGERCNLVSYTFKNLKLIDMKKLIFLLLSFVAILVCKGQVQVVTLTGIGSDSDGTVSKTEWLALSTNPSATVIATPLVTYTTLIKSVTHTTTVVPAGGVQWLGGVYKFVFRVTDNNGATSLDTMQVTFKVNIAPKANAGPDQTGTFNSTAIGGVDKPSDVAVNWRKLYGRAALILEPTKPVTRVTGLQPGLYVFEKTVKNSAGSARDWVYVTVRGLNSTRTLKAF